MADIKVRIGQSDAIKVIASRQGVTGESASSAYANQSGISSSSNYAVSAGVATYTTYAENSGIATNVIGGIGSVTQLNVTGISTFNEDVQFKGANTNARWDKSKSDLVLYNNTRLTLGDNEDFQMWHGGTNTFLKNSGGDLRIRGDVIKLQREDSSETYLKATVNSSVELYHGMGGSAAEKKIETTTTGAIVTGILTANQFKGDGSGLTGVTASGTGVNIRDDGSVIGVAATINFGQNLDVSPVSSGFVTVTAATVNQFTNLEVTGITTLSNLKISSGVITTTSGIVTYYGDVAQIDGGSY